MKTPQAPFDRFKEALKKVLSIPKKDLPLKAGSSKKPKASKS